MSMPRVRVWAEEVQPPDLLRFTWSLPEDLECADPHTTVWQALTSLDGVLSAKRDEDGMLVEIDVESVTRYDLAAAIRTALAPEAETRAVEAHRIRVWAEDLSPTEMRVTWQMPDVQAPEEERSQRRRVAAWLTVTAGTRSASPEADAVRVRYDPQALERAAVGDDVRRALSDDVPFRQRADELMKRAKIYGNLAGKLALDDRISPLPDAAKQAAAAQRSGGPGGNMAMRTAARFVPGAGLITRIQTLLPVLTELSKWSRENDPEIVESHLASVGLDRATLRQDTVTAHEIKFYARDSASETAAVLGEKASAGARQALATGREMFASFKQALEQPETSQTETPDPRPARPTSSEEPSRPEDLPPEDPRSDSA